MLFPTSLVGSYPQPDWLIDRERLAHRGGGCHVGLGNLQWLEWRDPGALARGATMLVGSRSTKQGDVDWDKPADSA